MMFYLIWIPLTFLWYFIYTWFVYKTSLVPGYGRFFWTGALFGAFPLWLLISKHSKDVMFDGIIYDIVLFFGCAISAGLFTGKIYSFNTTQWLGFFLVVIGLFMVKFK